LNTPL